MRYFCTGFGYRKLAIFGYSVLQNIQNRFFDPKTSFLTQKHLFFEYSKYSECFRKILIIQL